MKEHKLLVLGTLVTIFALYFITYSSSENTSDYDHLSLDDKIFFFNDLNDEQKEGIASTSMDSLKASFFEDSLTFKKIKSLPVETYESFQKISRNSLDIEQNLHIYRRLILILCLVLNSYLLFSKKYKFNITFQKAMFHNAIFSLIFSLFCIFSFILTQTIRGTVGDSSFMLQYGFAHFISILKSTLFWFVAVSFFIYFHPQNIDWYQRRMAKKNAKKNKN
ncbi:MAG: hypothetical protein CMP63_00060 [Flavobacteriales bacterium]|nr:hypothetical protein [Flavobacteriales bacterium]